MTLWLQWFTFFLTVNYVALGWFAGEMAKKGLKDPRPLKAVAALFIVQGVLGVLACALWCADFFKVEKFLRNAYADVYETARFPQRVYGFSLLIGICALLVVIVTWIYFFRQHWVEL